MKPAEVIASFLDALTVECTYVLRKGTTTYDWSTWSQQPRRESPVYGGFPKAGTYFPDLELSPERSVRKKGHKLFDTFVALSKRIHTLAFINPYGPPVGLQLVALKCLAAELLLQVMALGLTYWTDVEFSEPALRAIHAARELYKSGHCCNLAASGTLRGAGKALAQWRRALLAEVARQAAEVSKAARATKKQEQASKAAAQALAAKEATAALKRKLAGLSPHSRLSTLLLWCSDLAWSGDVNYRDLRAPLLPASQCSATPKADDDQAWQGSPGSDE